MPSLLSHNPQEIPPRKRLTRISIILVNYNGANLLPPCLDALATAVDADTETIMVDNASTDASLRVLKGYPWVKVVPSPRNLGFAGGNNLGLIHATGGYVLLLNTDTLANRDFLKPLCGFLDQNPYVGVVQGKMILPRMENTLDACGSFITRFGLPYHYGQSKPDQPKYQRNYPIFSAKGACLLFRRDLIAQVGGFLFDEDFFCFYEESDFCHRVWLAGYEVHFVAGPPIQHLMGGSSGGPQSAFALQHYLRNMAFSLSGNLSAESRLRILPLFYCLLIAIALGSILRFQWAKVRAALGGLCYPWALYGKLRKRRKLIQGLRKKTDREIFKKVLKNPRLTYFLKTFTGNLADYTDEEIL